MSPEQRLDVQVFPSELARIYQPIERDLEQLNRYLLSEFQASEPFIHQLLMHIASYRGKQIRPACVFFAARAVGECSSDAVKVAGVVELIHTATLVHDDVLDDARLRRRMETVNQRWGERVAVLLGDFIYSRGFSISTEVPGVSRLLADTTHTICEGELLQVSSAKQLDLSEERYYEIIRKKTAVLYGMACRVGALLGGASEAEQQLFEDFGVHLGMAFQIADDALDVSGDERTAGKSLGTDLKKGKMTLPLIRLRESLHGGKLQEYRWILEHSREMGAQQRVAKMLLDQGILSEVRETAASYIESAIALLDHFPRNPHRESMELLARFIMEREL
ncbi:MAG: polyprenyl synthetase family protein [Planctomycetota bacterium]